MEARLGDVLVRGGIVTREQLNEALGKERENGSNLIQELIRLGFSTEERLADFLATQFGFQKVEIDNSELTESVFNLIPAHLIQKHQVIPLKLVGSTLTVAMTDPTNLAAINEVKFITGYGVRVLLASA